LNKQVKSNKVNRIACDKIKVRACDKIKVRVKLEMSFKFDSPF